VHRFRLNCDVHVYIFCGPETRGKGCLSQPRTIFVLLLWKTPIAGWRTDSPELRSARIAEKLKSIPSEAKAPLDFETGAARVNSCRFKTGSFISLMRSFAPRGQGKDLSLRGIALLRGDVSDKLVGPLDEVLHIWQVGVSAIMLSPG